MYQGNSKPQKVLEKRKSYLPRSPRPLWVERWYNYLFLKKIILTVVETHDTEKIESSAIQGHFQLLSLLTASINEIWVWNIGGI